ncbi:hypothetical protein GIB67_019787 [Kingdonia uniflora]|uniref:SWIM-type domain-containing protein n=1 Tax=Kingdonia uniflora TaxID=39325 RepID=A0A7J7MK54_9MAGN|nr:hypothetical protein GIB67_019787 [Kingdonia uniflora]
MKLISLRAHLSYEDFVTLLEEACKIRREDWLFTTKDTGSGKGLSTTKAGGPLRHNSFPDPEPEYKGYPETNGRGLDPRWFRPLVDDDDVPQSNDSFKTIRTDVPLSNEPSILQSNVHLSNEPMLTNVPQSNEPSISQSNIYLSNEPVLTNVPLSNKPMLTNVPLSIEPEHIIGQTEPLDARQLLVRIPTAYELLFGSKTRRPPKVGHTSWRCLGIISTIMTLDSSSSLTGMPYGVAYTNYVESWNNVILKVRDLPIHVFIEELHRICSEMSYTYREEDEKSQARLTPWATDYCVSKKTDSVNIEDGTCSCRWWKMMGIPCEHGVHALGFANVDPTTRVSAYFTNDIYKAVYEPIWIPIRGIEQWKILKTDLHVHAPIPTVQACCPRTQRKRREKCLVLSPN